MSRIILKLSGEALAGPGKTGFDEETVRGAAKQVRKLTDSGCEVGIVTGGGNFWRGRTGNEIDRVKSDQIGMLATVMNCIYVSEIFRSEGMRTRVFTPFEVGGITELFSKDAAVEGLRRGEVVFFAGGTGHPYFSTDTGVVLRAIEVDADVILMAKNIDGIYDSDPMKNPAAKRFDTISVEDVIAKDLQATDLASSILAKENRMPMRVFALQEEDSIVKAASGKFNGTTITVDRD
ncbi:MAG: UMP kinase [Lachnospiraceae bacterium]|jgi:uridylate kinase|nr:UMP kinase [Lachnospiraceae bacterium]